MKTYKTELNKDKKPYTRDIDTKLISIICYMLNS